MSKLLPLLMFTILVIASIIHTTPKIERQSIGQVNPVATFDSCTYRPVLADCLDDSEDMEYNVVNNDGSICKAQYFGICVDGMTNSELTELETFKNNNQ